MDVFFHPDQLRHHPRTFVMRGRVVPCPEVPGRADALLAAVRRLGLSVIEPPAPDRAPVEAVHGADYLEFLETGWDLWQALPDPSAEITPNVHPTPEMRPAARPIGIVGLAGWHLADTACPVGEHTWTSALAATASAVAGAQAILGGASAAYALCRPPGHHAYADRAGGFCYLNNAAVAAEQLRLAGVERVSVLDIDVHHGNGTQGIFWRRGDVQTVSVHANPARFYPWFCGYADEVGDGPGKGANVNLPRPLGLDDDGWLAALDEAAAAVRAFDPAVVVLALGLDPSVDDPLQGFAVTPDGFARAGRAMAALSKPTLIVQEGGYPSDSLGSNLERFLDGFLNR